MVSKWKGSRKKTACSQGSEMLGRGFAENKSGEFTKNEIVKGL